MEARQTIQEISKDFFVGLRSGLGGPRCGTGIGPGGLNTCKTPGQRIKSKGKGRGLARGEGRGPVGVPFRLKF